MNLTPALQKLLLHSASFLFFLYFTTTQQLKFIVFLIAVALMAYNLWSIIYSICTSQDDEPFRNVFIQSTRTSMTGKHVNDENMRNFENRIRTASKKMISQQRELHNNTSKLFNNFSRETQSIQQLRRMSLADLSKDRVTRETNYFNRDEGSAGKKLRSYLMSTRQEETSANKQKIVQEMSNYFKKGGNDYKSFKIDEHHIEGCYQVVKDYMGSKLEEQIEQLTSDLQEVQHVIHKCFSLTLTLQQYTTQNSITYGELLELVQIIDKKSTIPTKYTNNISAFEIKQEISHIRDKIARIPNLTLAPNILRLMLIIKNLRNEFPEQNIIFGDCDRDERSRHGQKHIFRVQDDDRCFYHNYSNIKSRCGTTPVLLFLMHLLKKHNKSINPLLREIRSQIDYK